MEENENRNTPVTENQATEKRDMSEFKSPLAVSRGGIAFTLASVLPQIVGIIVVVIVMLSVSDFLTYTESDEFIFISLVITQITMLAVAVIGFGGFRGIIAKSRIRKPRRALDVLVVCVITLAMLFGTDFLYELFMNLLGLLGYTPTDSPFPAIDSVEKLIVGILIIGVLPSICEELVFRGVIANSLRNLGYGFAIVFSGALFSLMHASPLQTVHQFIMGMLFAYIYFKGGTLLLPMIMHFLNNSLSVIFEFAFGESFIVPDWIQPIAIALVILGVLYFHFYGIKLPKKKELQAADNEAEASPFNEYGELSELVEREKRIAARTEKTKVWFFYGLGIAFDLFLWIYTFTLGLGG